MVMSLNHIHLNNNKPTRFGLLRLAAAAVLPAAIHHCQLDYRAAFCSDLTPRPTSEHATSTCRDEKGGWGWGGVTWGYFYWACSHVRLVRCSQPATWHVTPVAESQPAWSVCVLGGMGRGGGIALDGRPFQCFSGSIWFRTLCTGSWRKWVQRPSTLPIRCCHGPFIPIR